MQQQQQQPNLTFVIVGLSHRLPAPSVVKRMAVNTTLICRPEPSNPYDSNAIAVWVDANLVDWEKCRREAKEWTEPVIIDGEFQLGYIPAKDAELLRFDRRLNIRGKFIINSKNRPCVKLEAFMQ